MKQFIEYLDNNMRSTVLKRAAQLVNNDRENSYGTPEENLGTTARYWGVHLGIRLEAHHVATMMELAKIARRKAQPTYEDNWTDAAGYAALGYEVANCLEKLDETAPKIPLKK